MGERPTAGGPFGAARALKAAIAEKRSDADDTGAALILALVFLIVAALTLTALVTFAGTGLLDTAGFTSQRSLQYGANGAVEIAIQNVRYQATSYTALKNCLGTTTDSSVQLTEYQRTAQYRVYCQGYQVPATSPVTAFSSTASVTSLHHRIVTTSELFTVHLTSWIGYGILGTGISTSPMTSVVAETTNANTVTLSRTATVTGTVSIRLVSPFQRLVTFYACRSATCPLPATNSKLRQEYSPTTNRGGYLVKAVVGFGDLASTGADTCSTASIRTCGESMIVTQWTVSSANH